MSKIRLHGSSSGYTEIAPVAASGNNTLTLPNDGTIISKDSAGAVGVTSVHTTKITNTGQTNISNDIKSADDDFFVYSYKGGTDGQVRSGIQFDASNQRMEFYTATNERLRIESDGNLQFNSGYGSVATAFGVRAWADIYWNSGTPTARDSGNVNSISDDGTGDMTISFSTAMPDTNYSCLVSGDDYGNSQYPGFNVGSSSRGKTTSGVSVNATQKDGTARDIAALNFAVIR